MDFENEFNRVPEINEKDFQWLIDRTTKYYVEKMINPLQEIRNLTHSHTKKSEPQGPLFFCPYTYCSASMVKSSLCYTPAAAIHS